MRTPPSEQRGEAEGIYVDFARRLANKLGVTPRFEIVPFARVAHLLDNDDADVTISLTTEALEKVAIAVQPVRKVKSVILLAKGKNAVSRDTLREFEIGRLRGGCRDLFGSGELSIRSYELNSLGSGIRMLTAGRLDGICATQDAIEIALAEEKVGNTLTGSYFVVSEREAWVHVRKSMPLAKQEAIRRALRELLKP